jgi:hypothetical protein
MERPSMSARMVGEELAREALGTAGSGPDAAAAGEKKKAETDSWTASWRNLAKVGWAAAVAWELRRHRVHRGPLQLVQGY